VVTSAIFFLETTSHPSNSDAKGSRIELLGRTIGMRGATVLSCRTGRLAGLAMDARGLAVSATMLTATAAKTSKALGDLLIVIMFLRVKADLRLFHRISVRLKSQNNCSGVISA
jgi:hypothetical protein